MTCVSAVTKYKYHCSCTYIYMYISWTSISIFHAKARNLFLCILQENSVLPHIPICMIIRSVTATQSRASPWQKAHHHQASIQVNLYRNTKKNVLDGVLTWYILLSLPHILKNCKIAMKKSPHLGDCVTRSCNCSFLIY